MKIITKYDIGHRVVIVDPGIHGRITEIRLDGLNLYYKVQYWEDGKCNCIELNEDEIDVFKKSEKLGL